MSAVSPATLIRRRARAALVAFVLVLLPALSVAGGLGIATAMAVLGIGVALLGLIGAGDGRRREGLPEWFWAVMAFVLWAVITSAWSRYPVPDGLELLQSNPAKLLFGLVLYTAAAGGVLQTWRASTTPWLQHLALAAFALTLGLTVIDIATQHSLTFALDPIRAGEDPEARRGDAVMNVTHGLVVALMLMPAALCATWAQLRRRGRVTQVGVVGLAVVALALGSVLSGLWVGLVGLSAVALAMAVAWRWPRGGMVGVFATAAGAILLAPIYAAWMGGFGTATKDAMPFSWEHRLDGWAHVAGRIAERPLFGHGFDSVRTFDATEVIRGYEMSLVSLHPHNAGLHIWAETGAVGAGLAVVALVFLARLALDWSGSDRARAVAVAGTAAAVTVVASVSYGVWQEWLWALVFLVVALIPIYLRVRG